jgi:hypothetical protein
MPLAVALLLVVSLWGLRWSLPTLLFAPTLMTIGEDGLWFPRFGLIPWAVIGHASIYRAGRGGGFFASSLLIQIADLADRVKGLAWASRIEWNLWVPKSSDSTCLVMPGKRFKVSVSDVLAAIEARRPPTAPKAPTP